MQRNLIIGAGQAGHCAAVAMRAAGFRGQILLLGDELLPPYERPPLSKDCLGAGRPTSAAHFAKSGRYSELEIELRLGDAVRRIDIAAALVETEGGGRIAYDSLLIANGAAPRPLAVRGGGRLHYLRTLPDAQVLARALAEARHLICIGAGVIGLEVAATSRKLGLAVTVLEAGERALARSAASEVAERILRRHRENAVDLQFGQNVTSVVNRPDGGVLLELASAEEIQADCAVVGIGVVRNDALAREAGLAVDDGVLVDAYGRSSAEGVYAAGDVAAFLHPEYGRLRLESYFHAQGHGTAVGRTMAGVATAYADVPRYWTDQYDLNVQVAGLPGRAMRTVIRGDPDGAAVYFHLDPQGRVAAATAINSPREMRPAMMLIKSGRVPEEADLVNADVPLAQLAA